MTCEKAFTIYDGVKTVTVTIGSISGSYSISKDLMTEGIAPFRGTDGTGAVDIRFQKYRYTISGNGPADPDLFDLNLVSSAGEDITWNVTIPGFADGSTEETWTVVPAYPTQTKDRLGGVQSWTLTLEEA